MRQTVSALALLLSGVVGIPAYGYAQSRLTDGDLPALRMLIDATADRRKRDTEQFDAQNAATMAGLSRWPAIAEQWKRSQTDPLVWYRSVMPSLTIPATVTYDRECSFDRSVSLMGMVGRPPVLVFSLGEGSALMEATRRGDKAAEEAEVERLGRSPGGLLSALMPQIYGQSPADQAALRAVASFYRGAQGVEVTENPSAADALLLVQSSAASGDSLAIVVVTRTQFFSDFLSECTETLPAGLVMVATMRPRVIDTEAAERETKRAVRRMGKEPDALMSLIFATCNDAQPDGYPWLQQSLREETGAALQDARARDANVQWYRRHEAELGPRMRSISAAAGGDGPCG